MKLAPARKRAQPIGQVGEALVIGAVVARRLLTECISLVQLPARVAYACAAPPTFAGFVVNQEHLTARVPTAAVIAKHFSRIRVLRRRFHRLTVNFSHVVLQEENGSGEHEEVPWFPPGRAQWR